MTVEEGLDFFKAVPVIRKNGNHVQGGLGYIHIGQQATTCPEVRPKGQTREGVSPKATGKTLYILDEPTTGLHFEDVRKLIEVLQALVDQGNSNRHRA